MNPPDVVVVGAGPAGSVAATVLARAGARVRLIDRARFPRPKLCGDTINPGALAVLQKLDDIGEGSGVCSQLRARALPVKGMTVSGPTGVTVTAHYPDGVSGLAISRADLDLLLVEQAAAAGVDVMEGVRALTPFVEDGRMTGMRVLGRVREFWPTRLVIVADGRGSRLASMLHIAAFARQPRRWAFGAYFSGVEGVGTHGEMHLRRRSYMGLAPLPDGLTNVCLVRPFERSAFERIDQKSIILQAVASDPWLRDRFRVAQQETAVTALGPLAVDATGAGCPGALVAGDAGGFVDPMTGDGLRFAMYGGMLAADAAVAELATGRPAFESLEAARQRAFAGKWRFDRTLRMLSGSPRMLTAATWIGSWWPSTVRHLVQIAGDLRHARPLTAGHATAAPRAASRA